jgi:electron transfer flavoprotein alpha subunit
VYLGQYVVLALIILLLGLVPYFIGWALFAFMYFFLPNTKVNLKSARVIVAGGAGLGSRENFRLVWDLANCLGAAPAGTRAAVDLGFIDHDHQVGQTGTTVRPNLYIAVGVSGAIQHRSGMDQSQKIIAINKDPDAPIFGVAHYKIIGDLNDVVPRMIKALREKTIKK